MLLKFVCPGRLKAHPNIFTAKKIINPARDLTYANIYLLSICFLKTLRQTGNYYSAN
jgi:hypothetical protein